MACRRGPTRDRGYDELLALVEHLRRQLAALLAENACLRAELDAARRAGKHQAAPFRKGPSKLDPKRPCCKAGDLRGHRPSPLPAQFDEVHELEQRSDRGL